MICTEKSGEIDVSERITRDPDILGGNPVIAGTRIPVRAIKSFDKAGFTPTEIRDEYPGLTLADIDAALEYTKGS
jgi:uncharacterized protein (DUF433 family)